MKMVLFRLDTEIYGLDIFQVKEILKKIEIISIPNAPDFIRGLINLRGEVTTVVDAEKRFGLKREVDPIHQHIILCQTKRGKFGLVVDEVLKILTLPEEKIEKTTDTIKAKIDPNFLLGVGVYEEQAFVVLDAEKILSAKEIGNLKKIEDRKKIKEEP